MDIFSSYNYRRYLRLLRPYLWFVIFVFLVSFLFGYSVAFLRPEEAITTINTLSASVAPLFDLSPVGLFGFIFLNNLIKTLGALVLGVLFGVLPLFFLSVNGVLLGVVAFVTQVGQGFPVFLAGIIPHGIFELTGIFIGTAIGVMLGVRVFEKYVKRKEVYLKPELKSAFIISVVIITPLLLLASAVEVLITPNIIALIQ